MTRGMGTLEPELLSRLCDFVSSRMGLHFPCQRWDELQRRVGAAARQLGHADGAAFIEWLLSSAPGREQIEVLASYLTVGETYFWREPQVFEALEELVLPDLIRKAERSGRRLRLWSAGCATGEEPYSIAIAVRRALPARGDWSVSILATDISPVPLRRAKAGVYGGWSFRNAPPWLKSGYFTLRDDGRYALSPEIRGMVTFAYLNLAEDVYPSPHSCTNAMDVIFCRNVLMYFAPERIRRIGERLFHSLVPGGWFAVGAAELSQELFPWFVPIHARGAILYRRDRREAPEDHPVSRVEPRSPTSMEPAVGAESCFPEVPAPLPSRVSPKPPAAESGRVPDPAAVGRRREAVESTAAGLPRPGPPEVRALANRGLLAEALAACETAIAADRVDPGLRYLAAVILEELGRKQEAVAAFRSALYLDQTFVLAYFSLGNLLLRAEQGNAARKCFENALSLLHGHREDEIVPESEGLTAGRLRQIVQITLELAARN